MKSNGAVVIISASATSVTLLVTGVVLTVVRISAGSACAFLGNKVLYKIVLNKSSKYRKQYRKYKQNIESFDIL